MKPAAPVFLAAAIGTLATADSAKKGPSFGMPNWYFVLENHVPVATDILIVTEGGEIDGKVTVEEVLYGPKKVGDELDFPDLTKFAPEEARTTVATHMMNKPREGKFVPEVVPAGRMMLFLGAQGMMTGNWDTLQNRHAHTMLIISLLGELKTPAALAKVREIRDFCGSEPALKNTGAPSGLLDRCSVALGEQPMVD